MYDLGMATNGPSSNMSKQIRAAKIHLALVLIVLAGITALYLSSSPHRKLDSVQAQTNGNCDETQQIQVAIVDELTDPPSVLPGESKCVVELNVYGNEELKLGIDAFPDQSELPALAPEPDPATSPSSTPTVAATTRVLRIKPSVRAVSLYGRDTVMLRVIMYDRQGIIDDSLAEAVNLIWEDGDAGGSFEVLADGVAYTVPENPGRYTVSATVDADQCFGDENQCRAEFEIIVRRGTPIPWFPEPPIPTPFTGPDGTEYLVLTPVEGGTYTGEGFSLHVPPGAVENGEFIGINVRKDDAAANGGQTRFGYALANERYTIAVVDASGGPIEAYLLKTAAQICIPTPPNFRDYLSEISMVSVSDAGFAVLSSKVIIPTGGHPRLCGSLEVLSGQISAAKRDAPEAPVTGGSAASLNELIILMLAGAVSIAGGVSLLASKERRVTPR